MTWCWIPIQTWVVIRDFSDRKIGQTIENKRRLPERWGRGRSNILNLCPIPIALCCNKKYIQIERSLLSGININIRWYKYVLPKTSTASCTNIWNLVYEHFWYKLTYTSSFYLHFCLLMFLHNLIKMEYYSTFRYFFDS